MFSLFFVVSDHLLCSATLVVLCQELSSTYVFTFPCCFRSFVMFCYSGCTVTTLTSACMFSLILVVSDHMFCSATLVALCLTLSSACMFSLSLLFRIICFVL